MARTQGRVMATIWTDPDFTSLPAGPQRLYLFLISQSDLNHAGLIPLRARRWAAKCAGYTAETITADLEQLVAARFVVVDHDTEEVLVRTLVRNDGVYKQPKLMVRLVQDAYQIESTTLRNVLRTELTRLPLDELSDNPGGRNGDEPSTRECVRRVVNALVSDLTASDGTPTEGVSDTHPDTHPEEDSIPPCVRARAFHQPPTTSPLPPATKMVGDVHDEPQTAAGEHAPQKRRQPSTPLPDDWQPTDEHRALAERLGLDLADEVWRFRNHAVANDKRQVRWNATFNQWLSNSARWNPSPATRPGSGPPVSTTDARMAAVQALKADLRPDQRSIGA